MRKRVFFIILMGIFMILILVGYPHLDPKYKPAQNIFDEMYKKNTNTSNPAYYHGDYEVGIRISRATDENMLDTKKINAYITYKKKRLPKDYQSLTIYFYGYYQYMTISFNKEIEKGLVVNEFIKYDPNKKRLEKSVMIIKSDGKTEDYIQDDSQIKVILSEHQLGKENLDHYYDEIVNGLVLKDWLANYDSKFNSDDYGKFTTKTQWEEW